ncbi:DUF3103 family protein [Tenacibaculum sp. C7A-26P2]|uniref:DUF3103 family protein n=1 Tax=Tenacibaculum sp. C7A-26P2 TaxID=3447504 RepID=UPI003F8353C5
MKTLQFLFRGLLTSMIFVSCNNESSEIVTQDEQQNSISINKKEIAFNLITLMKNDAFKNETLNALNNQKPSVLLSKILKKSASYVNDEKAYQKLLKQSTSLEKKASSKKAPEKIEILEVWLHNPQKRKNLSNVLFSFSPEGDEKNWEHLVAYTLDKEEVILDAKKAPDRPVIVIETNGYEALKKEVYHMNKYLREEGVQNQRFNKSDAELNKMFSGKNALETTKLDKIRLNNDEEPWISGAAEIYAITSGIKDGGNKPEIKVIPMYYLDYDETDYYPNQILLFWDDYKYQAANIQLFEKDDNINYKNLVTTIVNGVFQIVGTVSTQPWIGVLGQVAGAIIQAMPNDWYTNNDDYVDSFYTIEKYKEYRDYCGARKNATVALSPFYVSPN